MVILKGPWYWVGQKFAVLFSFLKMGSCVAQAGLDFPMLLEMILIRKCDRPIIDKSRITCVYTYIRHI